MEIAHKHSVIQTQSPEEWAEVGTQIFRYELKSVDGITQGRCYEPIVHSGIWLTDVFCFSHAMVLVAV